MRRAFVNTLIQLAERDERIVLLTGDVGFSVLESFRERFGERFMNVGVAEQNMVGLATGLAEAGFLPFVYSIGPFAVLRPYEFIRNGPVAHQLPVRIIGVGTGVDYASNGMSHYNLEDVAVLRVQTGVTIICPADSQQAQSALERTWDVPGPVYYRLGKDLDTPLPGLNGRFVLGRAESIGDGADVLFVSMGSVAVHAAHAIDVLASKGTHATLGIVSSFNPAPVDDLRKLLERTTTAVSVEDHRTCGGLGSLVAEIIADFGLAVRLRRCGLDMPLDSASGSREYLYQQNAISTDQLVLAARDMLERSAAYR